jgi:hypothetical protein
MVADTPIRLFLSHSCNDKTLVRAVGDQLTQIGYEVWLDENRLAAGDRIHTAIEAAVNESDYLILFITQSALDSFWVDEEWRSKFEQQLAERRVRVLPVLLAFVDLPPSLKGRVQIRAPIPWLFLRTGYREIDQAVREHERRQRGGGSAPVGGLQDVGSIANMLREVDSSFDRSSRRSEAVVNTLRAVRESAIVRYDTGNRQVAATIYAEILRLIWERRAIWRSASGLTECSKRVHDTIETLLNGAQIGDVWASRMVLDETVDFFHADSLFEQFVELSAGMTVPVAQILDVGPAAGARFSDFQTHWWPFEHLRYAMEGRDGFALDSFSLLSELCDAVLIRAEVALSQRWDAGPKTDLHEAVVLRMVRWPGARVGACVTERRFAENDGQVGNSVNVLWDVYNMDMCNFPAGGFWRTPQDRAELLEKGSLAVFDRGLTNRGYPRDSDFWLQQPRLD